MEDHRTYMTKEPNVCEFEVEVIDAENPSFTGWDDIHKCLANEIGVPEHQQCRGKMITVEKDENDFKRNIWANVSFSTSNLNIRISVFETFF